MNSNAHTLIFRLLLFPCSERERHHASGGLKFSFTADTRQALRLSNFPRFLNNCTKQKGTSFMGYFDNISFGNITPPRCLQTRLCLTTQGVDSAPCMRSAERSATTAAQRQRLASAHETRGSP